MDPAQSLRIILTTVTDVIGFSAFLGFVVMFQDIWYKYPGRLKGYI